MSSIFDVFWNRNITSVVDAEESMRKEKKREAEQQLIADIFCQDGFHSRHRFEEKKQDSACGLLSIKQYISDPEAIHISYQFNSRYNGYFCYHRYK